MPKILIGSKLPNGLVIQHPTNPSVKETLRGLNDAPKGRSGSAILVPYMTTEIDADLWKDWYAVHNHPTQPFPPLKNGAIFVARTEEAAKKIAAERKEPTGLEPMKQTGDDRLGADKKLLKVATSDDDK